MHKIFHIYLISETFLLVPLLLERLMDDEVLALLRLLLHGALGVVHSGARVAGGWLAVHGAMHLASVLELLHGGIVLLDVDHPLDGSHGVALGPHGGEVHVLLHDVALLPGHGAALLLSAPHLVTVPIDVPVGDAVILGHLPALWQLLLVLDRVVLLLAVLVLEVPVGGLILLHTVLLPHGHAALRPGYGLALELRGLQADFLRLLLTGPLDPDLAAAGVPALVLDHVPEGDVAAEVTFKGGGGEGGEEEGGESEEGELDESHARAREINVKSDERCEEVSNLYF